MGINENHPKYEEYMNKVCSLEKEAEKEIFAVPPPPPLVLDEGTLNNVFRKHVDRLKALKKEYAYLFTEETDEKEEE